MRSTTSIGLYSTVFSSVSQEISIFGRRKIFERGAQESPGLCAVQRVNRVEPSAVALDRAAPTVFGDFAQQALSLAETSGIEQKPLAVTEANLSDDSLDPCVQRAGIRCVSSTIAGTPQSDSLRIYFGEGFGEADGVANIVNLF